MLHLKNDKIQDSGKKEQEKRFYSLQALGMNADLLYRVRGLGNDT